MTIILKAAKTTADKENVYRLRHHIFVEEEQRFDMAGNHLFDRYDSFEETTNFLAFHNNRPVAGIRLVLDGPGGLPAEEAFDFSELRQDLEGGFATVGWFCISKPFRRNPGLAVSLIQMCFRQMRQVKARHVLAVMHPPALPLLSRLVGARPLGPEIIDHGLGVGIIPVHVDLENLPDGSRERFVDPDEHVFEDANERRLYRKGEAVYTRGDEGNEVFQIMRGVVRVEENTPDYSDGENQGILLGPGQVFGELSAMDGRQRASTVTAYSTDVDVMVWDNRTFRSQLSDPQRAVALCRLMAQRVRRSMAPPHFNPSSALAARLLVGASGQKNQPVDARWLAGQCGVDRGGLSRLVMPWAQDQVVSADSNQKKIWVIDRPRLVREAQL